MPGLGCFDLDTYLNMVERSRKWQCPHSMRNVTIHQLHMDTYAMRLLEFLKVGMHRVQSSALSPAPICDKHLLKNQKGRILSTTSTSCRPHCLGSCMSVDLRDCNAAAPQLLTCPVATALNECALGSRGPGESIPGPC